MNKQVLLQENINKFISLFAALFALYHILIAGGFIFISSFQHRVLHLGIAMLLGLLIHRSKKKNWYYWVLDIFLCGATIWVTYYLSFFWLDATYRIGNPSTADYVTAILLILCILEFGRRTMGATLSLVAILFFIYTFIGPYLPGFLAHRGQTFQRVVGSLMLSSDGILGMPISASANYIVLFIILSAFLQTSGAGQFFLDFASALVGWTRGGPAKIAVIASGLFGSINGSALGNVVGTGSFTIPLMKRTGYPAVFAGAVEAIASTGGQLMPPVMGTAAFIIAEFLGLSYFDVVKAATLPAILYFTSLLFVVDLEAAKLNLKGIKKKDLPKLKPVLKNGWPYLIPLIVLVTLLMFLRSSIMKAGFWAIIVTIPCAWLVTKKTNNTLSVIFESLILGVKWAIPVAAACAVSGMIIGTIGLTGLAYEFSGVVISLAGNNLFFLLVLTAISSILLGMGMPTTPAYIFASLIAVPPLLSFGVPALSGHLFVFYFAIISSVTPPVALSAFAAAGIANASPYKIGWTAAKIGIAAFLVPFLFVYGPELLMIGETHSILIAMITSLLGCYMLSVTVSGWLFMRCSFIERLFSLAAALLLLYADMFSDLVGLVLFASIILFNRIKKHRNNTEKN